MHSGAELIGVIPAEMPGCGTIGQALETLTQARSRGAALALIWVGLAGRAPGGEACAELGRRLRAGVRAGDPICWLGANGYVVLLLGAQPVFAASVATRLARLLETPVQVAHLGPGESPQAALERLGTRRESTAA
jgi:hypothetical protein